MGLGIRIGVIEISAAGCRRVLVAGDAGLVFTGLFSGRGFLPVLRLSFLLGGKHLRVLGSPVVVRALFLSGLLRGFLISRVFVLRGLCLLLAVLGRGFLRGRGLLLLRALDSLAAVIHPLGLDIAPVLVWKFDMIPLYTGSICGLFKYRDRVA